MRHLILAYHAISATWPSPLAVPQAVLAMQLGLLQARGYVAFTLAEWERRRLAGELPRRSVVVTFDDGYKSTLLARPVLESLGYTATVFPVLKFLESGERLKWAGIDQWAEGPHGAELESLTWDDLTMLHSEGWEIGAHTVSHPNLTEIPDAAAREEMETSRLALEQRLGSCESLAYPYGLANESVGRLAEQAGFLTACTLTRFCGQDDPFFRARVGIYPGDQGLKLRVKFSPTFQMLRRRPLVIAALGDG